MLNAYFVKEHYFQQYYFLIIALKFKNTKGNQSVNSISYIYKR